MSDLDKLISSVLKGTSDIMNTEDLIIEAFRDYTKDELKAYIREKLEEDPALKQEIKDAVKELIEAKVKEAYAVMKLGKCGAKLGMKMIPEDMKDELTKEFVGIFQKEINDIIEKAL